MVASWVAGVDGAYREAAQAAGDVPFRAERPFPVEIVPFPPGGQAALSVIPGSRGYSAPPGSRYMSDGRHPTPSRAPGARDTAGACLAGYLCFCC
jgi:hypothetical protein